MRAGRHRCCRRNRLCFFKSLIVAVAFLTAASARPSRAESTDTKVAKPALDKFSSNHDGTLTEDDLWLLYLYEQNPALMKTAPPDELTPEQRKAAIIFAHANQDTVIKMQDLPHAKTHTFDEVTKLHNFKVPGAPAKTELGGILLRGAYEQIDLGTGAKTIDKAQPANFSYVRNRLTNQNVWTAQGALMRPFVAFEEKQPPESQPYLSEIQIVPSVSFDRLTGSGVDIKKQTDSLIFRLGSDTEFGNLNTLNLLHGLQDIRLNFSHATDFEFRSQVLGGEADWEPTDVDTPLGLYKPLLGEEGPLKYRLRFYLHGEAGSIVDPGQKAALATVPDDYARMGFFAQGEIQPMHFNRVTLTINYLDYESLISDSPSAHLFTAGLTFALDEAGNINFQIKYRDGRLPLTLDKVEDITIGLAIKL
jgi:hypothetical protein